MLVVIGQNGELLAFRVQEVGARMDSDGEKVLLIAAASPHSHVVDWQMEAPAGTGPARWPAPRVVRGAGSDPT